MDKNMSLMRYLAFVVLFMAITSLTIPVLLSEGNQSKTSPVIEESEKTSEKVTTDREGNPIKTPAIEPSVDAIVYYFHGYQRCWTCRRIEELARLALEQGFSDELEDGRLQWQVVNIEADDNEHFVNDYSLYSRALVVQRIQEGKNADWKNLQRIWELVGNEEEFVKYVQGEVSSMLGEMR
jgi:hypothetical protein